ncbi:endonuclease/exonuclease/phosphatase family protein [Rhizobium alvei]|uniref:Endonuclease/exonuclease/phosphatase family protein n=1 Tax=Rhizobium alvei TaxID=1132659 RepID=A0ABT8YMQ5_9HYPH|nr:endonuclease/exonuclease/phosphatase family protein [Rhizobium alvei]MDO6965011.1 endonuclease/exonuclease/phosphatase family protein [Rhizobium alvei]
MVRILSLNAWGGRVHEPLIPYLAGAGADILCLQEIVHTPAAPSGWLDYRDGDLVLPQRARLFEEVAAAVPNHRGWLSPSARGTLEDEVGRPYPSEFGIATFVSNRLSVIEQAVAFIHGDFSASGWGEHPRPRNAHALRLYDGYTGRIFTIIQLHGLRDPVGKADTPARTAQAERLASLVDRFRRLGEAMIVCGDFNLLPDSKTFEMLSERGLTELITTRGFSDTRTSYYAKAGRYADYLLVSPEAAIVRFDVVAEPEVSDHRALVLDFN